MEITRVAAFTWLSAFRLVRACWNMEEVSGSGARSGKENDVRSTSLTSSPSVSLAPLNGDCFLSIKL